MPKLKRRKDGGYFIHAAGNNNPVNTFQVTDRGAEIVKSSGRALDEFFPDQLFYLLHDLDHLSTKGAEPTDPTIGDITNIDWATDELSVESRVQVALQLIETHGVSQLFAGDAAKWVLGLTGNAPVLLEPLVEAIAAAAGYSYETIHEYDEMFHEGERLLDVALCAYLQYQWLRDTATFDGESQHRQHRVVHGSTGSHIYIEVPSAEQTTYTIPTDMPESIDEALRDELRDVWGLGVGSAGFAALASFELTNSRRRTRSHPSCRAPRRLPGHSAATLSTHRTIRSTPSPAKPCRTRPLIAKLRRGVRRRLDLRPVVPAHPRSLNEWQ